MSAHTTDYMSVEEFARHLKQAQLVCRSYGHNALPSSTIEVVAEGTGESYTEQILRCRNHCGVKWRLLLDDATGQQIYRRADYTESPGYLAKGVGRIDFVGKGTIRLEWQVRHRTKET